MSPRKVQTLRSKTKEPPGFNSDVKRFDISNDKATKDKNSPIRGPGYYETDGLTSIKPKKGNHDYFT